MVPILAGVSGKAHVKPLTYVSALMALAGVGLLVEKGGVIMPGAGDMWSLLSAVFFGIQARACRLLGARSVLCCAGLTHGSGLPGAVATPADGVVLACFWRPAFPRGRSRWCALFRMCAARRVPHWWRSR